MTHCRALDCEREIPPNRLFCAPHWYALPKPLRDAIWKTYQPGQERANGPRPSQAYIDNLREAERFLAEHEGKQPRLPLERS
jgi:hypothetical protein